ncbi:MAG: hypothetical protein H7Z38_06135, partial [Rubrivivax sp.]|nr:hypothetical protein [Pyrinomonadaceae bacterium]
MNKIRQTISLALVVALVGLGLVTAQAQVPRRPNRMNDRQVGELIRRVEVSANNYRATLANALDRSSYNGTSTEDDFNRYVQNFETATDQLRERFNGRTSVAADVENLLRQASVINDFMQRNRLNRRAESDWTLVRTDLDALARAYNVRWDWTRSNSGYGQPTVGTMPYRITDREVDALIRRIENGSDRFSASLNTSLDRSRYDGTRAEDNINQFVRDFENATDQLRTRFTSRNSATGDVENVLRQATYIDDFMRRQTLSYRAENDWTQLRRDLTQLASIYSVAWNWDVRSMPGGGTTAGGGYGTGGGYGARARLTGTFRLDPSQSDNANTVADRATRNLPFNERQRVREQILRRLESPDMIAIERNGNSVTIASSRAPQTTFDASGAERREQLPNGTYSRVTTQINGDQLIVRSAGDRATDFSVTFDPIEGGRRLRVTREIWNDQLGQNPVVVQNVYDRTSDTAQWNVYTGTSGYGQTGSTTTFPNGDYIIPNGQAIIATLDNDLTTKDAQVGQRFTMTVTSPVQYEGAIIEGTIASVSRSGKVTGRADLSFDFDTIRTRDNRTYQFAGFIEGARMTTGEIVKVDNEGTVRDNESQGTQTVQRAAIGTAVGAIIGAIAGGGKGAAIG